MIRISGKASMIKAHRSNRSMTIASIRRRWLALSLLAIAPCAVAGEADAVVFGQIQLGGEAPLAANYRLTIREVDTGELVRLKLEKREPTGTLFDFAQKLQPGKYYMYQMVSPQVEPGFRIADPKNYFEIPAGTTVYLGTWTITLGAAKTSYSVDYDLKEAGLFARANPARDLEKFMIGVVGAPAVPLKAR